MPSTNDRSHDDPVSLLIWIVPIRVADNLHDKSPEYRIEAAFFLAAASVSKEGYTPMRNGKNGGKQLSLENVP
ncbi:MAG: hypothetical protein WDN75_03290 [Bacteroidota bacterium]